MTKQWIAILGTVVLGLVAAAQDNLAEQQAAPEAALESANGLTPGVLSLESQQALVDQYCVWCHNDVEKAGDMTLSGPRPGAR